MCIIIDSDRLSAFLAHPLNENAAPIHNWLNGTGKLVYSTGDAFSRELSDNAKTRLKDLNQRGRAEYVPDDVVSDMAIKLRRNDSVHIKSNDHHVLALAIVSGARLLYTGDNDLMADFKNKKIVDNPRGSIYSDRRHSDLLKRKACSI